MYATVPSFLGRSRTKATPGIQATQCADVPLTRHSVVELTVIFAVSSVSDVRRRIRVSE